MSYMDKALLKIINEECLENPSGFWVTCDVLGLKCPSPFDDTTVIVGWHRTMEKLFSEHGLIYVVTNYREETILVKPG